MTLCQFQYQLFVSQALTLQRSWGIPSEKIGQNIHPPESRFLIINYQ